jgi:peptidoglycan pentaglycine glycine transferase (the first glycine)
MTERQQIDTKPPEYFETLISIFAEQKNASIFFCRAPRVALGCGTDHILRGLRHLLFGASMEAQRNVMAPYLLHFEIMRRAKAVGFKEYDFWGVAPENEPNESWYDISVFKRKFGGREVNLIPPLD